MTVGASTPTVTAEPAQGTRRLRKQLRPGETLIQGFLFLCGFISIFTTLGIVVVLASQSWRFFTDDAVTLAGLADPTTANGRTMVLLVLLLSLNAVAILLRHRYSRRKLA